MATKRLIAYIPIKINGIKMESGTNEVMPVLIERADYEAIREIVIECGKPFVTLADMLKFVKENHPRLKKG